VKGWSFIFIDHSFGNKQAFGGEGVAFSCSREVLGTKRRDTLEKREVK